MNKPSPLAVQAAPALSGSAVSSAPPPREFAPASVPPVPAMESVPPDESVAAVESPPDEAETDEIVARLRERTRAPRRSESKSDAEHKQKRREWWARMQREARESSIRQGYYKPGGGVPNPRYDPAVSKAILERGPIKPPFPDPGPDSTDYIRRARELNWGHGCTEEEMKEIL